MINFYSMRYQRPRSYAIRSVNEGYEIGRDEFNSGYSCCQMVIDEDNRIIYSLTEKSYLSENFEYEFLNDEYAVYDTSCFDDCSKLKLITKSFKPHETASINK